MRRGFVDTPDGQVHYVTEGSGEPVVLLHPSPHSWNFFWHTIPVLAERFRVIAMDTMGYGDSDRPNPPYTEMIQYARSVTWLLDGLGLERAHLVGHLTGAEIATEVAAAFPERVGRLVLSEVFNWNTESRRAVHERLHWWVPPSADGSHLLALWNRHASRVDQIGLDTLERFFLNLYKVNVGEQPTVYGTMGWDGAAPWVMCRYPFWERVVLIEAPTLVLHGEDGDLVRANPTVVARMKNAIGRLYPKENRIGPLAPRSAWSMLVRDFLTGELHAG
ncbi:MAG: epoxide hydrolase [Dehalococcoidia bacterium]|nr:MAG: epoxide hydrolase [Dehalococcoidia bacterium]